MQSPAEPGYRDDWATPQDLVDALAMMIAGEEHFDLDVCALRDTAKAPNYIGPDHEDEASRDALTCVWDRLNWCNPPFGAGPASDFVERAMTFASTRGLTTAVLLPNSKTEQDWHIRAMLDPRLLAVIHVAGRIGFEINGKPAKGNRHGSEVLVFGPNPRNNPISVGCIMRLTGESGRKAWTWAWR
jgi:hypothetical protein